MISGDQQKLEDILRGLGRSSVDETKILLASLRPNEVAMAMEANQPGTRRVIWQLLDDDARNQSLQYLREDVRAEFLEAMDTAQLVAAAENLDTDDFADILQQLPATITTQVLENLDARDRARVESVLSYPEDSEIGRAHV